MDKEAEDIIIGVMRSTLIDQKRLAAAIDSFPDYFRDVQSPGLTEKAKQDSVELIEQLATIFLTTHVELSTEIVCQAMSGFMALLAVATTSPEGLQMLVHFYSESTRASGGLMGAKIAEDFMNHLSNPNTGRPN